MLEKTLESPLDSKEIKSVSPKGNQPWIFIGRTDAEAEALIFWPSDARSWLTGKDPDAGKDWGQQRMRWLAGIRISMEMSVSRLQERTDRLACAVHGVAKSWTWLRNWITIIEHTDLTDIHTIFNPTAAEQAMLLKYIWGILHNRSYNKSQGLPSLRRQKSYYV